MRKGSGAQASQEVTSTKYRLSVSFQKDLRNVNSLPQASLSQQCRLQSEVRVTPPQRQNLDVRVTENISIIFMFRQNDPQLKKKKKTFASFILLCSFKLKYLQRTGKTHANSAYLGQHFSFSTCNLLSASHRIIELTNTLCCKGQLWPMYVIPSTSLEL